MEKKLKSEGHDYANIALISSLYPMLTKVEQVDIDTIPASKLQPLLKALASYNAAMKRAAKAKETAEAYRDKLEYELNSVFGDAELALSTEYPSQWGKEYCITYGGYFLLRKKEISRRVIDREALQTLLGSKYDLCFKTEDARGSLQTGIAIQTIIDKKLEKK